MVSSIYILFTVFFIFLQSTFIFGGDSAEFSTVARTWSISHPPGYPLYSLFINIINNIIPFGTTPWRIALLSSIPTIITAFFIYKILSEIKVNKSLALLSSIFYLFLFPVWQYALIPEVFGLHTMLVSIITYSLLRYSKKYNNTYLLVTAFVGGLCISHHHIFVLFIPGWLFLIKDRLTKIVTDKTIFIKLIILVLLGASFYLYAIIASYNNAVLDWENTKTVAGFIRLITRSAYGSFKAYQSSGANIANQISDIISGLVFAFMDFKPLGIIFICFGIYAGAVQKYEKKFVGFLYISTISHLLFLFYTNFVLTTPGTSGMFERFLIPLYFVLIFFFGIGADYFYKHIFSKVVQLLKKSSLKRFVEVSYFIFISLFILILALQNNKIIKLVPRLHYFDTLSKDILRTVPKGGILSPQSDTTTFVVSYVIYGLGERPDIVLFHLGLVDKENYIRMLKTKHPSLIISGLLKSSESFNSFIAKNSIKGGYFSEKEQNIGTWRPYGLLWKYYPDNASAASDSANLLSYSKKLWTKIYTIPKLTDSERSVFHLNSVEQFYINAYQNYAKLLVYMSEYNEAEEVLKKITYQYKKNDIESEAAYMNILVLQNKCNEALSIAAHINIEQSIKTHPEFIQSAIRYLKKCEPQNGHIIEYQRLFEIFQKSSKTNLNAF